MSLMRITFGARTSSVSISVMQLTQARHHALIIHVLYYTHVISCPAHDSSRHPPHDEHSHRMHDDDDHSSHPPHHTLSLSLSVSLSLSLCLSLRVAHRIWSYHEESAWAAGVHTQLRPEHTRADQLRPFQNVIFLMLKIHTINQEIAMRESGDIEFYIEIFG